MHRLTLVLTLALIACEHPAAEGPAAPPPQPSTSAPTPAAATGAVVKNTDGAEVLSVREESGGTITIAFDKQTLRGTTRDTGKRKYGDPTLFEVKPGDDGFKLRHADGKLLWKVKFKDGKIRISDNEENLNPFELKTAGDRLKVVAPGDRDLGAVRGYDVEDAAGKKLFTIEGKPSDAYGVLLLDTIPPPQRYILLAELLSRGK